MGLNCLLISTNQVEIPYPVYPLGVAHLAGALRSGGHRVSHYDVLSQGGLDSLAERIRDFSPDLVGLSIRNLDTVDSSVPEAFVAQSQAVISFVRKHFSGPVVLGGPAFSIMPERLMELLGADYGVVGEGEGLLSALAGRLESGESPGQRLFYAGRDDSCWGPTVFDRPTVDYYLSRGGMLNIQTKRGCPHRCAYCSYPTIEGRSYRFREPDEVAEEVRRLTGDYSVPYIFFTDSVFNDARGRYLEIAEALIRAGNRTPWCAFFRPQNLGAADLALLRKAGLAAMELGTDAASDTTLAGLQKDFSFAEVLEVHDAAARLQIPCAHFIIFGGPGEDRQSLSEGMKNVEKLADSVVFAYRGIRVLPGTEIFQRAVSDGVMPADQDLLAPFFYYSPLIDPGVLDETLREGWKDNPNIIYPFSPRLLERMNFFHKLGRVGPLWDLLISRGPVVS